MHRAASGDPESLLEVAAHDVSSTARTITTPMTMSCKNASMSSRFMPLRMTPIISAPTRALTDVAPAAEEARAADDHGRDRVELGQLAEGRRAGVRRPAVRTPATPASSPLRA